MCLVVKEVGVENRSNLCLVGYLIVIGFALKGFVNYLKNISGNENF